MAARSSASITGRWPVIATVAADRAPARPRRRVGSSRSSLASARSAASSMPATVPPAAVRRQTATATASSSSSSSGGRSVPGSSRYPPAAPEVELTG